MNYINDAIKINFTVPNSIKRIMEECEKLDKEENYGFYMNLAEYLTDTISKEAYVEGLITREQWKAIERRYIQ